jgi:bromodomain-containing factor 1
MLSMQENIEETTLDITDNEQSVDSSSKELAKGVAKQNQGQKNQVEDFDEAIEEESQQTQNMQSDEQSSNTSKKFEEDKDADPALVKEQLKYCSAVVLRGLKRHKDSGPFQHPVDPIALGIPDYPKVITHPMDLSTIAKKMEQQEYKFPSGFIADVRLMISNCSTYNAPDSQVHKMGKNLEKYFETSINRMPQDLSQLKSHDSPARRSSQPVTPSGPRPKREAVSSPRRNLSYAPTPTTAKKSGSGELTFCRSVLNELCKKQHSAINWPFMDPVDPVALGIPDYFDIIKNPMDLGTIRKKLDSRQYSTSDQFESDVKVIFSNCYAYNSMDSDISQMARQLEEVFENKWATRGSYSAPRSTPTNHNHAHGTSYEVDDERIFEINRQIQILQNELNDLLMRKKNKQKGGRASTSHAPSTSFTSGTMAAPVSSVSSAPGKSSKPTFDDLCKTELTFDEKRDLSEAVNNMPTDKLVRVVEIINENMPSLKDNAESDLIELDIESLDIRTLRRLQQYIKECKLGPKKRKAKVASESSAKRQATEIASATSGSAQSAAPLSSLPNNDVTPFPAESESEDEDDSDV